MEKDKENTFEIIHCKKEVIVLNLQMNFVLKNNTIFGINKINAEEIFSILITEL